MPPSYTIAPEPRPSARASLVPNPNALLAVIACAIALAVTKVLSSIFGELPASYVIGGIAILAIPTALAALRGAVDATGPDVWPAVAFYLSVYQSPVMRLVFGGRPLDGTETDVLDIALYAALAVSWLVCLRPGAFDPARARPRPLDDYTQHGATMVAYSGLFAALIGYALLLYWITSVGLGRMATASLGDIYLYAGGRSVVTFQWPFIVGGLVTMSVAFARWPGTKPSWLWRAAYYAFLAAYVATCARLGTRGPVLELFGAIYLVRSATRRPVSKRFLAAFAPVLGFFFFFVSAMRSHLDSGIAGTSIDEVSVQAESTFDVDATSEFDAAFDNAAMIVRYTGNQLPYLYGDSWTDLPLQLVPRQVVGSKPLGLSAWWIQYVDPQGAAQGAGRAFSSFAEGYLNFGAPGAIAQVSAVTVFLLSMFPLIRSRIVGIAPAAAATIAHGYHYHRSELILLAFTFRNAFLVGLATLFLDWLLKQLYPARGARLAVVGEADDAT
jgi:hypothetical protein